MHCPYCGDATGAAHCPSGALLSSCIVAQLGAHFEGESTPRLRAIAVHGRGPVILSGLRDPDVGGRAQHLFHPMRTSIEPLRPRATRIARDGAPIAAARSPPRPRPRARYVPISRFGSFAARQESHGITAGGTKLKGRSILLPLLLGCVACRSPSDAATDQARKVGPRVACENDYVAHCFTATREECIQLAQVEVESCIRDTKDPEVVDVDTATAWGRKIGLCVVPRVIDRLKRDGKIAKGRPGCAP